MEVNLGKRFLFQMSPCQGALGLALLPQGELRRSSSKVSMFRGPLLLGAAPCPPLAGRRSPSLPA